MRPAARTRSQSGLPPEASPTRPPITRRQSQPASKRQRSSRILGSEPQAHEQIGSVYSTTCSRGSVMPEVSEFLADIIGPPEELHQIDILAGAVLGHLHQVVEAGEAAAPGQVLGDVALIDL